MFNKTIVYIRASQQEAILGIWGPKLVRGRNFKICGDELTLDILELQMKKGLRGRLPFLTL